MSEPGSVLVWPIVLPLAGALIAFVLRGRGGAIVGGVVGLSTTMAVARVGGRVWGAGELRVALGGWEPPLGISLVADGLTVVMLMVTAVVALGGTLYLAASTTGPLPGRQDHQAVVWALWLVLWAGLNAVLLSGDLFNLYVGLEVMTLAAIGLVATAGGPALSAALRYLFWAMAGSLLFLLGVGMWYAAYGTVALAAPAGVALASPAAQAAVALMVGGLVIKGALFPLHGWLPAAHAAAPPAVSAVLSGLVVKAPFYIVLRLWMTLVPATAGGPLGSLLGALGAAAVFWGALLAFRQERLKLLVAYSTVAQLGYLFLGFALAGGSAGAVLLAVAHAPAKAAAFLGAGIIVRATGNDRLDLLPGLAARLPVTFFGLGLAALTLVGLPPSGTFAGKWVLLEVAIAQQQWWVVGVLVLGTIASAVYILRVVGAAFTRGTPTVTGSVPAVMEWACLGLALASIGIGLVAPQLFRLLPDALGGTALPPGVVP